jgi:hypothetical protein
MTTHDTDRPGETFGSDDPTEEQRDPGAELDGFADDDTVDDTVETDDLDDAEPEPYETDEADEADDAEPEPYETDEADEADDAEPEPYETDETDEADDAEPELVETDDDAGDAADVDRSESDPRRRLTPVGADAALDPRSGSYQDRWGAIQAGFIDDPRRAVESATALVGEVWDDVVRAITDERDGVDGRWQAGESSTDDLRAAMQDYRDIYARLLRFRSEQAGSPQTATS